MPTLPRADRNWCLFLDFDGTLVELEAHPDQVEVPPRLHAVLLDLIRIFDGAVAIISGRNVTGLDRLLAPLELPIAGVHGLERRDAGGRVHRDDAWVRILDPARTAVDRFVGERDGLHWEDKGSALAVHFRDAPERASEVEDFLELQRRHLGEQLHLQRGNAVLELKPAHLDKGRAIESYMREPPFTGRLPVFVGDDVTDEDGFAWVNRHGGISIRVGNDVATRARWHIPSVAETLEWLERLPKQVTRGAA